MNKAEAIIYIISAADLRADTLAGAHGGDAHFDMRFPRGKDEHRFHIGAVNYLVPIGSAKRMLAGFFENRFFALCGAILIIIAHGGYFHKPVFPHRQENRIYEPEPARAEPDNADLNASYILFHLPCLRYIRSIRYDLPLL